MESQETVSLGLWLPCCLILYGDGDLRTFWFYKQGVFPNKVCIKLVCIGKWVGGNN